MSWPGILICLCMLPFLFFTKDSPLHRVRQPKLSIEPVTYLMDKFKPLSEAEKQSGARSKWFFTKGKGYLDIQSTQPQSLGYGLADSPVGCLAWIYEKLLNWTDDYPWKDDEGKRRNIGLLFLQLMEFPPVLDWISIYWFSRAGITASLRIYFEIFGVVDIFAPLKKPSIPMGASFFPREIFFQRALYVHSYDHSQHLTTASDGFPPLLPTLSFTRLTAMVATSLPMSGQRN
jgi:hypothetical protein